jgi:transcriptional regulator with XRE-family HTH domain
MKKDLKNICGRRIKSERIKKGLTQLELSEDLPASCKIARSGIAKIELGERLVTDYELVALAKCLGTNVNRLVAWRKK